MVLEAFQPNSEYPSRTELNGVPVFHQAKMTVRNEEK